MEKKETESLRGSLHRAYENHLKREVSGGCFIEMERCFEELRGLCMDPDGEDEAILMKCFRVVNRGGLHLKLPRSRVELPAGEILRLLELGFRLGRVDTRFEVRVIRGKRVPCWEGEPLPPERRQDPMPCVLKHEALSVLHDRGRQIIRKLEEINRDEQAVSRRNKTVRWELEPILFGMPNPSRSRLKHPPAVSLKDSLLKQVGKESVDVKLSTVAKHVWELQGSGKAPSLFIPKTWDFLRDFPVTLIVLLDISASTQQRSLYKVSQIACASLLAALRRRLKQACLRVITYSDQPRTAADELQDFIEPSGTTNYAAVFVSAVEFIREEGHPGIVINVTDGLPDNLERACSSGRWLALRGIEYSQVVFGHVDRIDDLLEELMIREELLPQPAEPTRFERYISHFSEVAQACEGSQLVLWLLQTLPDAMLALSDLSIAAQWLKQYPDHTDWLEQLDKVGVSDEMRDPQNRNSLRSA